MNEQIIQIFVDDQGNVFYHAKNIPGSGCENVLNVLNELFDNAGETELTDEFFDGGDFGEAQKIQW